MRWWLLGMLVACSPVALPHVPTVSSDTGRACVHECQSLYDGCMQGAQWRRDAMACRQNLGGCYATCPA